jgi:hypothetical protein
VAGDLGVGVPNATVTLLAWMPEGEGAMERAIEAEYVGDGVYSFDPVELGFSGVWRLDIEIDAGGAIRDSASFGFVVE